MILSKNENDTEIDVEFLDFFNSKISSAAYAEKIRREKNDIGKPMFKELSITDTVWFMLDLPYVRTNTSSVYVNTAPFQNRSGILKNKSIYKSLIDADENIVTVKKREELDSWRQFSEFQKHHIESLIKGKFCCDNIQRFSIRPPEFRSVDLIKNYFKWFKIELQLFQ